MNEAEVPAWVKYAGDIFFLIIFLVVLFFFKAEPVVEVDTDEDEPNPLEKMLVTEDEEAAEEPHEREEKD